MASSSRHYYSELPQPCLERQGDSNSTWYGEDHFGLGSSENPCEVGVGVVRSPVKPLCSTSVNHWWTTVAPHVDRPLPVTNACEESPIYSLPAGDEYTFAFLMLWLWLNGDSCMG